MPTLARSAAWPEPNMRWRSVTDGWRPHVRPSPADLGETEEGRLGDREIGAGGGVGGVAGAHRDDEVVGIVAAVEEEADEGFVVGGDGGAGGGGSRAVGGTGGGAHEAEAAESGEEAGGTDGGAAGGTEEFAAGNFGADFCSWGDGRGGDGERGEERRELTEEGAKGG